MSARSAKDVLHTGLTERSPASASSLSDGNEELSEEIAEPASRARLLTAGKRTGVGVNSLACTRPLPVRNKAAASLQHPPTRLLRGLMCVALAERMRSGLVARRPATLAACLPVALVACLPAASVEWPPVALAERPCSRTHKLPHHARWAPCRMAAVWLAELVWEALPISAGECGLAAPRRQLPLLRLARPADIAERTTLNERPGPSSRASSFRRAGE
jgi:hypothetical protein